MPVELRRIGALAVLVSCALASSAYRSNAEENKLACSLIWRLSAMREAPEYVYMRGMSSFQMENYADAIPDLNKAISMKRWAEAICLRKIEPPHNGLRRERIEVEYFID